MSEELKIYPLIDRLKLTVEKGKSVPFTKQVMLNREELVDLLDQLEPALTEDVQHAKQVLDLESRLIGEAQQKVCDADAAYKDLVARGNAEASGIVNQAHADQQQIVEKANADANAILVDANARLADAQEQANMTIAQAEQQRSEILADANARAEQLVDENEITTRARAKAEEILDEVQRKCTNLQNSVCTSLLQIINQTEEGISSQIGVLNNLKESIPQ